ncbi:hypothetical protein B0H14DRAFT_3141952 [Mycena olivaceomarginata]|nr:hypothetical protein B0H14DRAFT_3141952 [Mycena olivaceomarginata]
MTLSLEDAKNEEYAWMRGKWVDSEARTEIRACEGELYVPRMNSRTILPLEKESVQNPLASWRRRSATEKERAWEKHTKEQTSSKNVGEIRTQMKCGALRKAVVRTSPGAVEQVKIPSSGDERRVVLNEIVSGASQIEVRVSESQLRYQVMLKLRSKLDVPGFGLGVLRAYSGMAPGRKLKPRTASSACPGRMTEARKRNCVGATELRRTVWASLSYSDGGQYHGDRLDSRWRLAYRTTADLENLVMVPLEVVDEVVVDRLMREAALLEPAEVAPDKDTVIGEGRSSWQGPSCSSSCRGTTRAQEQENRRLLW